MPQPSTFNDCLLRRVLYRWAAKFTPDEQFRAHLVEMTIVETLREFPEADDNCTIDIQLLATMRQVLLRELGVHPVADGRPSEESRSD
ncbi:hypothetical protein EM858_04360 [Agrobacterium sp. CNPSo 2736]|uniref:hypothetical protein n=1 Tax=Agrobacterium sp. CNPSo 2736 TaxID=2499627 RepID=UPI000FD78FE9|nr:hypothetical protein [Agrobacterium sp. CNPSo 2736]RVT80234.1 hypothetical protein EM858_04360 [Agrobacterium sp. CNPSo 2736]